MSENFIENFQTPIRDPTTALNCAACFCTSFSPIILNVSAVPVANAAAGIGGDSDFCGTGGIAGDISSAGSYFLDISKSGSIYTLGNNQRLEKSYWVSDYSDDILESLREEETKRYVIAFRSQQYRYRPALLQLLKMASEKYNLARTTLHLAVYLLDCFMDNFTVRLDKLNLTTLTCLMVAAKMEEADMDMPKFVKLNELVGGCYTLSEYKNVENKLLFTFDFKLLRPTAATFSEFFVRTYVTIDDYHNYKKNYINDNNNIHPSIPRNVILNYQQKAWEQQSPNSEELKSLPLFNTFDEMLISVNEIFFNLVDMSLSYLKFTNARPSVIAAACIGTVRQLFCILPAWTPHLEKITKCNLNIIMPYMETLLVLYKLQKITNNNNERIAPRSIACDSPDSGIFSTDTKSCRSSAEDTEEDENEDNSHYNSFEYAPLKKRRRIC